MKLMRRTMSRSILSTTMGKLSRMSTVQPIARRVIGLLDVDYNRVSAYGHFGKADLPWEK